MRGERRHTGGESKADCAHAGNGGEADRTCADDGGEAAFPRREVAVVRPLIEFDESDLDAFFPEGEDTPSQNG